MKKVGFATVAASALIAGFLGLAAPAAANPPAQGNAQKTIDSLEGKGYHVVVNRLSNTPLTQANVISVHRAQNFSHSVSGANKDNDKLFGPVNEQVVYVNVK